MRKKNYIILILCLFLSSVFAEDFFNVGVNSSYNNSYINGNNFSSLNLGVVYGMQHKKNNIGFQLLGDLQFARPFLSQDYSSSSPFYLFQIDGVYDYYILEPYQKSVSFMFTPFSLGFDFSFVYHFEPYNISWSIGSFFDYTRINVDIINNKTNNIEYENAGVYKNLKIGIATSLSKSTFVDEMSKCNIGLKPRISFFEKVVLNDQVHDFQPKLNFEIELFFTISFGKNNLYYERQQKEKQIEEERLLREKQIEEERLLRKKQIEDYVLNLKNNPTGPFGISWGITPEVLNQLSTECSITEYSVYEKHYLKDSEVSLYSFTPEKSVDFVSKYYAVIDNTQNLYQIFTVCNSSDFIININDIENIAKAEQENDLKYEEIKAILIEKYGQPVSDNKTKCIWNTELMTIELFKEVDIFDYIHINGSYSQLSKGYSVETYLAYSDIDLQQKVNNRIQNKINEAKQKEIEQENLQKSYF